MTEQEIHQKIEDDAAQAKEKLYSVIHEDVERSIAESAQRRKRRKQLCVRLLPVLAAVIIVAVCLSIVLPVVLSNGEEIVRFQSGDLTEQEAHYTVVEYNNQHGNKVLLPSWCESADFGATIEFRLKNDPSELVCLSETIVDIETGNAIVFSVILLKNVEMDKFDSYKNDVDVFTVHNDVGVRYNQVRNGIKANFAYGDFKYYLEFNDIDDLDYVKETIESMFN